MVNLFESLIIIAPELILAITAMSLLMIGSFYQKTIDYLSKYVANDENSYKYLAKSITIHPPQKDLIKKMESSNFKNCKFNNLSFGVVSIHKGYKL